MTKLKQLLSLFDFPPRTLTIHSKRMFLAEKLEITGGDHVVKPSQFMFRKFSYITDIF